MSDSGFMNDSEVWIRMVRQGQTGRHFGDEDQRALKTDSKFGRVEWGRGSLKFEASDINH